MILTVQIMRILLVFSFVHWLLLIWTDILWLKWAFESMPCARTIFIKMYCILRIKRPPPNKCPPPFQNLFVPTWDLKTGKEKKLLLFPHLSKISMGSQLHLSKNRQLNSKKDLWQVDRALTWAQLKEAWIKYGVIQKKLFKGHFRIMRTAWSKKNFCNGILGQRIISVQIFKIFGCHQNHGY